MARIGFIGLGNMGLPMALNLVRAGHRVMAFDIVADAVAKAVAGGGEAAASAADAVHDADAVITMLRSGSDVRGVLEESIFGAARPGALLIDCSTIDVATARAIASAGAARGFVMADAPVSGGVAGAAAASLTFMVGVAAEHFVDVKTVLAPMGRQVIHAGGAGAGQAAKICNNMLLGASMIACAEAFALAEKLGLEAQTFFDIASKASGQCWSMTSYCPVPGPVPSAPSNRDYEGGFAAALMLKDLKLAVEAAQVAGASVPMGSLAAQLYQSFGNLGGGAKDFSAIIKLIDGGWRQP